MVSVMETAGFGVEATVRRLQESLETLLWGISLVPEQWQYEPPPFGRGPERPWSAVMNLAHLVEYEELVAAPVLQELTSGRDGTRVVSFADAGPFERLREALSREPLERLMARLRAARQAQIAAVRSFTDSSLNSATTPLWGEPVHSAGWVAAKTVQHTWEHGNSIVQVGLFAPR